MAQLPQPRLKINLDALHQNLQTLCSTAGVETSECIPVIKNSAYGLGSGIIAHRLEQWGVTTFAVATLAEALFLRHKKSTAAILVLGRVTPEDFSVAEQANLTISVIDATHLRELQNYNGSIALNIDTGMHRCGLPWEDIPTLLKELSPLAGKIRSLYTHLHSADSTTAHEETRLQQSRFSHCCKILWQAGIQPPAIHCANSAGSLFWKHDCCTHIRPGIALFGCHPDPHIPTPRLADVASIQSTVCSIRTLKKGEGVSYGHTWHAPKDTRIATIALGYSDGLPRTLSTENLLIQIGDTLYPQVGRITMDYLMVDIGDTPVHVGDLANITHEQASIDTLACAAGTIGYELLCRFGYAMTKEYYEGGKKIATLKRSIF
ncbi:alanine racemase [Chitinivibrio alkaliphilus]|uniref:Alanine racemase n=1 Tax=Chitinivibrio alkaliphilus ACht1 TaxID=1313304 RepID=U7D782_9BACT|nr:alanine racemase [Chitinivibrio alkaliphilus]ERP31426.1 alanine racemase [Chitinivibrio alkaliphilus ACht1]